MIEELNFVKELEDLERKSGNGIKLKLEKGVMLVGESKKLVDRVKGNEVGDEIVESICEYFLVISKHERQRLTCTFIRYDAAWAGQDELWIKSYKIGRISRCKFLRRLLSFLAFSS